MEETGTFKKDEGLLDDLTEYVAAVQDGSVDHDWTTFPSEGTYAQVDIDWVRRILKAHQGVDDARALVAKNLWDTLIERDISW